MKWWSQRVYPRKKSTQKSGEEGFLLDMALVIFAVFLILALLR